MTRGRARGFTRVAATLAILLTVRAWADAEGALLIVHPTALAKAAESWRSERARQGWNVELSTCDGCELESLRASIRAWATESTASKARHRAVLLLGDAPTSIPTFRVRQTDASLVDRRDDSFATDGPYQDLNGDGVPDLMLGRIPVSDEASALQVLEKIRAWESSEMSDARRRVALVAGEGRFGPYDALLETLAAAVLIDRVPAECDLTATYAKASSPFCPPPSKAREIVRDRALGGALLFNYVGHGHPRGFDALWWKKEKLRLLEVGDVLPPDSPDADPRPGGLALLVCCSVGWFDDPKGDSLAETLLKHPSGPVAIFAGSRPTHPYANAIVEREGIETLLRDRVATVGEWDFAITRHLAGAAREELDLLAAPIAASGKWTLSLADMRRQHALLYNLLGDPTTRIAHAPRVDLSLRVEGTSTLVGTLPPDLPAVEGLVAEVSIAARRTARPAGVDPANGRDDEALESKAAANWPRANEWIRWRGRAPVVASRFAIELPQPLPADAAEVVVILRPRGGAGEPVNGGPAFTDGRPGESASPEPAPGDRALVGVASQSVARLLGSPRDGQGLPSDRGASPR